MPRWKDNNPGPQSNAYIAYSFFIERGYTPAQAAGLVGNFAQESTVSLDTSRKGFDGKGSVGIAQWLNYKGKAGGRKDRLKDFAHKKGTDWTDLRTQLEFVDHELHTTHKEAYNLLMEAQTPEEAALVISKKYEKPGEKWAENGKRVNYANQFYKDFTDAPQEQTGRINPDQPYRGIPIPDVTLPASPNVQVPDNMGPKPSHLLPEGSTAKPEEPSKDEQALLEKQRQYILEQEYYQKVQRDNLVALSSNYGQVPIHEINRTGQINP